MAETITAPVLTREERRQRFIESGWWVSIPCTTVPAHWLYQGENRLDANFYAQESQSAHRIVSDSGFLLKSLGEVAKSLWYPSRFKRILTNADDGIPFIGATEILQYRPETKYYIARNSTTEIDALIARDNSLFVTRSGSVGRVSFFSKRLQGKALSEHIIRVEIVENPGYIYALVVVLSK